MAGKVLTRLVLSSVCLVFLTSCSGDLPEFRFDRNKNDFQLYPLDIKVPVTQEEQST